MTPRQFIEHEKHEEEERVRKNRTAMENWHVPLSSNGRKLKTALASMKKAWQLDQGDIPFSIKLAENPSSPFCQFGILCGCVDLFKHDCIHILLGRGVLLKDEAFVIGYTMGSTKKINWFRERLFLFMSRWFYPVGYKFYKEEREVFRWGVIAGQSCRYDLTKVNFKPLLGKSVTSIRKALGLDTKIIKVCYALEGRAYPDSKESQRLL